MKEIKKELMKGIFPFSSIIFCLTLASCSNETKQEKPETSTIKVSRYERLISKYKQVNRDTLAIYSPEFEKIKDPFMGVKLDSMDAVLFPEEIASAHFADTPGLFACYRFFIDSNRTGLITRTPSEYSPTSIKLFIYERAKDTITRYIELAERFGDAGDFFYKYSWVIREGKQLRALILTNEGHFNEVDNPNDTTVDAQTDYHLININTRSLDTLSSDSAFLAPQFSGLVKKARLTLY